MIIECTNCHSKYQYDAERFERKPSKKIKCAKCQHVFEIFNPAFAEAPSAASKATEVGEATSMKKAVPKAPAMSAAAIAEAAVPAPEPPKEEQPPQFPRGKRFSLAIIDGPDAGSVFRLEKPRVVVGRAGADIVVNDTEVSRQHAAVEIRESAYTLIDLGSTNGTLYEGNKVDQPTEMQDKSEFIVGGTTLMLIVTEEA